MSGNQETLELADIKSTRFRVMKTNENDESKPTEDETEKDTMHTKSLKYFTREALPRLDNYRNFMSIQAAYRPTLEDLHDPISLPKNPVDAHDEEIGNSKGRYGLWKQSFVEFGWLEGIVVPNLLSICGPILFLEFSRIVMLAGLVESLLLILLGSVASVITALSVCAISTNGFIKEGGTYVMMSRSLGPEFGIPIGIALLISNIGLCAMYVIGLIEYAVDNIGCCISDCNVGDVRYFSAAAFTFTILLVIASLSLPKCSMFLSKIRIVLIILLAAVFVYFVTSLYVGLGLYGERIIAFNVSKIHDHLFSKSSDAYENKLVDKFTLFAIIYTAFAAFLSGISGCKNLKDPLRAIPKGTIYSILVGVILYVIVAVIISGIVINTPANSLPNANSTCVNYICEPKRPILHVILIESTDASIIIHAVIALVTFYCILTNCRIAIVSLRSFSADKLYPKASYFSSKFAQQAGVYMFVAVAGLLFIVSGKMTRVAVTVSVILLAAYALINFSTFHISLIQPIGWRPTFKKYNMWVSLCGAVLCVCTMFLIDWVIALVTVIMLLAMYLLVTYQKPDVNWGSTTQAQTYNNALLGVYALNNVADHVKNYRPQVLVLSGLPSNRPPLVTFARLITKNLSLMICGNIHSEYVSQNDLNEYTMKARNWLKFNRIKAFYSQVDEVSFERGAQSLMQATGLGKLRPNVLLMGYKSTWMTSSIQDVDMYFNTIHKALDKHLAVCILRLKTGINFSDLKVNHEQISKTIPSVKYEFKTTEKFSLDPKNDSENQSSKKFSYTGRTKNGQLSTMTELNDSCEDIDANEIYKYEDGMELSGDMMSRVTIFQRKQKKGTIDVWWLYDDGGLTLLLPYIISTRRSWASCKLRVFALAGNSDTLEFEQRNMASLLSKFRIDYSDLTIFSDLTKKCQEETMVFYENLVKDFVTNPEDDTADAGKKITISKSDLDTMKDKTNRHLRLRELLLENSQDANLIVMTLPIPRKSVISAPLYMSWLEALTQDMPPFLLVRGNQTSVLTFYS